MLTLFCTASALARQAAYCARLHTVVAADKDRFLPTVCPLLQERSYIEQVSDVQYTVKMGFVPNMRVPGTFYVDDKLKGLLFEELQQHVARGEVMHKIGKSAGSSCRTARRTGVCSFKDLNPAADCLFMPLPNRFQP